MQHIKHPPYNLRSLRTRERMAANQLNESLGKGHRFKVFRMGWDVCAQCQKPRKEHERLE